jgi:hypothetical protein
MKKKMFLSVALIALMAVGAFAQAYTAESDFTVTKTATAVTITKYVGTGAAEVNIPPTIQNLPVTTIGGNIIPANNFSVKSLTIPASVTSIQMVAFYEATNLLSVTFLGPIPANGMNSRAFTGDLYNKFYATEKTNGTPGTYTRSGNVWTLTTGAATTTTPANSPNDFYYSKTADGKGIIIDQYTGKTTDVRIPDRIENLPVVEIEERALAFGVIRLLIRSVVIPNTVTKIGNSAFDGQANLTSVTLPTSLVEIGNSAFSLCESLNSISLSASIKTIGVATFRNCTALTTVTIPASVTKITFGNNAFQGAAKVDAASQTAIKRVGYTGSF